MAAFLSQENRAMRSSLHDISFAALGRKSFCLKIRWTTSNLILSRLQRWCYSTRRQLNPRQVKVELQSTSQTKDPFYVVRKGDLVGVYKSFKECQEQLSAFVS